MSGKYSESCDSAVVHINRLVLNFPGFETTDAKHQIERLTAGGHKTGEVWNFDLSRDEIRAAGDKQKSVTEFQSKSDNWTATTKFVHFSWTDIIEKYEDQPYPQSLFQNFPKYFSKLQYFVIYSYNTKNVSEFHRYNSYLALYYFWRNYLEMFYFGSPLPLYCKFPKKLLKTSIFVIYSYNTHNVSEFHNNNQYHA